MVQRASETAIALYGVAPSRQMRVAFQPHPIFREFDAHKWNCMFAFHLGLHLKQAEYVVSKAKAEQTSV